MRIAIIGSGISGNGAAYALANTPDIDFTVYEKENRVGGHACTHIADYNGQSIPVDIGFIVYNTHNYHNLTSLFEKLGVETQASDMGFSVSLNKGEMEWAGHGLASIFAQKKNMFSIRFLRMLRDIFKFNKQAQQDLKGNLPADLSLGDYLKKNRFSEGFINGYLLPMGAAIWSTPDEAMLDFPARSFLQFFDNHRLIYTERPRWRTVSGGSRTYVEKITAPYHDHIRFNCGVSQVERSDEKVFVTDFTGQTETYDHVIFASHSDQTLSMLSDADNEEQALLTAIPYRPNVGYLHCDETLMPKRRSVWAAWNYIRSDSIGNDNVCVSYWMNALQGIDKAYPLFVTLNPHVPPRQDKVFHQFQFDHPQYSHAALDAQAQLHRIQGRRNTWFCGAWTGYGFHEDGLRSGLQIGIKLGGSVPWDVGGGR